MAAGARPNASILQRFDGAVGRKLLVETLRANAGVLSGDAAIAETVAAQCTLAEFGTNDVLIRQDGTDTDVFIVLSGLFRVFVNGREIGERGPGEHLGEMAAIDLTSRRTATVIASRPSLVAKMSGPDFLALADEHPVVWRAVAVALCRRLDARKKFHRTPNDTPRIFIGSSRESLTRAEALKAAVETAAVTKKVDVAVTIWSKDVFGASSFPIDDLEVQLGVSDFAVLVADPDDKVTSRGKEVDAPRDNVIFELGLFMGALSRGRTFLLVPRGVDLKIPTDLLGLTPLHFDPAEPDLKVAIAVPAGELVAIVDKKGSK